MTDTGAWIKRRVTRKRWVYKLYNLSLSEVSNPIRLWVGLAFILINTISVVFCFFNDNRKSGWVKNIVGVIDLVIFLVVLIVTLLSYWLMKKYIANSGGQCLFKEKAYLAPNPETKQFGINAIGHKQIAFVPVARETLEDAVPIAVNLHVKAFSGTAWETTADIATTKIRSHLQANSRSILFLCPSRPKLYEGSYGFTHIIPVNSYTWYRYKQGLISADEVYDKFIVRECSQSKDDEPFGLIIFGVVVPEIISEFKSVQDHRNILESIFSYRAETKAYQAKLGALVTQAVAYHIDIYLQYEFSNHRTIPVLFESMSKNITDYFSDFETNGKEYSKDGARIVCFEVAKTIPS